MDRRATADWSGTIKSGKGTLTTESKALSTLPYSFSSRFEDTPGTNPEELIAAAHAGCFTMALSGAIEQTGKNPEKLETKCTVSVVKEGDGFKITKSKLELKAKVPGMERDHLHKIAEEVKKSCPVSKALNVDMDLQITEL